MTNDDLEENIDTANTPPCSNTQTYKLSQGLAERYENWRAPPPSNGKLILNGYRENLLQKKIRGYADFRRYPSSIVGVC